MKNILEKVYVDEQSPTLEYVWVFVIVFFLVFFLSQALFIWVVGAVKSGLLWLALVIWSVLATYYLLFGNSQLLYKRAQNKIKALFVRDSSHKRQIDISRVPEIEKLLSKPSDKREPHIHFDVLEKKFEQKAHDMGALISGEGIKHIMSFGGGAEKAMEDVIERGRSTYPRFDGWVVLNKSQVVNLLSHSPTSRVPFSTLVEELDKEDESSVREDAVSEELAKPPEGEVVVETSDLKIHEPYTKKKDVYKTKNTNAPINLPAGALQSKQSGATATFMGLLCDGDERALFTFIREMRQGSDSTVYAFITESILMLDRVHEHRVDGVGYVDQQVLEKCRCFSNEEIEEIIAILIRSIDHRYKLPEIGVKLALVRAMEYVKKHRKD